MQSIIQNLQSIKKYTLQYQKVTASKNTKYLKDKYYIPLKLWIIARKR